MPKRKKRVSLLADIEINRVKVNSANVTHTSTMYDIPEYYVDLEFKCGDCGVYSVWWANDQKWWHEIKGNPLEKVAIRCKKCRDFIKEKKQVQKEHMAKVASKDPHPYEKFFKKHITKL